MLNEKEYNKLLHDIKKIALDVSKLNEDVDKFYTDLEKAKKKGDDESAIYRPEETS